MATVEPATLQRARPATPLPCLTVRAPAAAMVCSYNELLELQLVLERAGAFFEDARSSAAAARDEVLEGPALGDRE